MTSGSSVTACCVTYLASRRSGTSSRRSFGRNKYCSTLIAARAYNAAMRTALVVIAIARAGCGTPHRDGNGGGDGGSNAPDAPPVNLCKVQNDSNGIPNYTDVAPANNFDPDIQWTWTGPNGEINSIVTALVANLTDDNGDGAIDL